MICEHVCSSECRRSGCNCQCPTEFHQETKPKLNARQMELLRNMQAGNSVEAQLNKGYEKEWNRDYSPADEGIKMEKPNEY